MTASSPAAPEASTSAPVAKSAGSSKWFPRFGPWPALLIFTIVTVIAMWPAVSDISNTIMGFVEPSDATAGGVWLSWSLSFLSPFSAHTAMIGAPQGSPFWLPTFITGLGWLLPMWAIAHVAGPIATWNILVFVCFVADAMAMYGLVRWLVNNNLIAVLAGVLYAFSPFHIEQAYVHIGYLNSWIFPLIVWAALALVKDPTIRRGLILGVAVGASAFIDGYYIIFSPLTAGVVVAAGIVGAVIVRTSARRLIETGLLAGVTAIVLMAPVAIISETGNTLVTQLFSQYRGPGAFTVDASSARFHAYFVPWDGSPSWARVAQDFGTHPVFIWGDGSIYLGLTVMLLAMGMAAVAIFRPDWIPVLPLRLPTRFVAIAVPAATIALTLFSFAHFGPIWGFPRLLWLVKPFWRSYSRMYVAIDCLLVLGAATAVAMIANRRRALAVVAALLMLVDATAIFPWSSWSFAANTPPDLAWLAKHQDGGVVMGYSNLRRPGENALFQTFQVENHHPLVNGSLVQVGPQVALARALVSFGDPETIPTLRRLGVRYVALQAAGHEPSWASVPSGVRLEFAGGGDRVYRILPGTPAPAALTIGDGLVDRRYNVLFTGHWMFGNRADLGIQSYERSSPLRVTFRVRSYRNPSSGRRLWVTQSGRTVWSGHVGAGHQVVSFVTASRVKLVLHCEPTAVTVPGVLFPRSIEITRLSVTSAGQSGSTT